MPGRAVSQPRACALVGPYASGKTSLLESLLFITDTIHRRGSVRDGTAFGDSSPEARARAMSVEANIVAASYLGDPWTFFDCPGSIEFLQETFDALAVADVAVVVVEPTPDRARMVAPLLKFLDERGIGHVVFINKCDGDQVRLRETFEALQLVSDRPLVLRELPIRDGDRITGYVDLASERSYRLHPGGASNLAKLPDGQRAEEQAARQEMLERLADLDDHLLEELLEDVVPASDEVYGSLARDLAADLIVPVFFGSAERDFGVRRLLKALRHETPQPTDTARRLGLAADGPPLARVFKTVHAAHTGKLSWVRVWRGTFADGATVDGQRISGLHLPTAAGLTKAPRAVVGDVVALGRLDAALTGQFLGPADPQATPWPAPLPPLFPLAVHAEKKADEVKLTGVLAKLVEEDPSLSLEQTEETGGEMVLWGQGEIHLLVALDKLKSRFNLAVQAHRPQVPYKETIRHSASQHGRHKRQSGGHGQFGDIYIDIAPLPRGAGFQFSDTIVGGVVPKQYIPAVEEGARDYLRQGPLGFPVVDVGVTLTNGSFHAVDSSDMAFKTAARIAMTEGMAQCDPVLLEPILHVEISVPADFTAKAQRVVSGRRGQILGHEVKTGWIGWDVVAAYLPQAEMADLIIELRSLTMGVGTFSWRFDHLQELTGRTAEKIVAERKVALGGH